MIKKWEVYVLSKYTKKETLFYITIECSKVRSEVLNMRFKDQRSTKMEHAVLLAINVVNTWILYSL